jgi:DNA (cytosine-5)-methyltransferase 1
MRELSLFSGAGGGILGGTLLGWKTVCAVEIEKYCIEILLQRQRDGILPRFPIWDDITTFDGKPWKGRVDIITGGFPCQDISAAGKGAGLEGKRSGLWKEMARIVCEIKPEWCLIENSPLLTIRGLGIVLGDLATMGYDARWGVLGACDVGAKHKRERIWILANTNEKRSRKIGTYIESSPQRKKSNDIGSICKNVSDSNENGFNNIYIQQRKFIETNKYKQERQPNKNNGKGSNRNWWSTESELGRVADGLANRVDRIAAIGNGQVPSVAAVAFIILSQGWYRFEEDNKGDK